ncbi:S41 family peptidase [Clostridium rectalis]|uniref:S41 family peptidase n=1 Tax=Clostridium rectalis TaxID=2040295 RepID=UPI000F631D87|nr:S41 family peptidase [Clostridium rectalis]
MKHKRGNRILGIVFTLMFTFICGISSNVVHASSTNSDSAIDQVRYLIRNGYIKDVPKEILEKDNIKDIVKGVGDPYTEYFSSEDFKDFTNAVNNTVCGIGIYNEEDIEGIRIKMVMDNSPAKEVGIKQGDIITKVDDKVLKGVKLEDAIKYLKGEEGTKVKLVIKRGKEILIFSVERKKIEVPTVQWNILDNHIAYIKIQTFGMDTPKLFLDAVNEVKDKVDRYIIDLRNNTGGYTNSAYNIAGNFIGEDTAIIMKDKGGNAVEYKGVNHGYVIDKPTIFLINDYTASASELLSAAIKDYNKAFFIGIKSFGKGIQQSSFPLSDGGVLKLTTHSFYSPKGSTIHKVGIIPDLDTKDMDPLLVAKLLYSGKEKEDKTGLLKVKLGNEYFLIDLTKVTNKEYYKGINYIVDKAENNEIYLGTSNGFNKTTKEFVKNERSIYFNNIKKFNKLVKNKQNNNFIIKFNMDLDKKTINNETIKLVNENTFDELDIECVIDDKKVIVTPKKTATLSGKYCLIVDNIKSKDGKILKEKTSVYVEFK